jgi:O-antigen/teichoic acid export membrane protein
MKTDSYSRRGTPNTPGFSANPRRHMVEGTIRVFLGEMLLLPTGLLTAAYLTRKLAPEGYGLFTVSAGMVAWIEWSVAAIFAGAALKLIGEADDWRPIGAAVARLHFVLGGAIALTLWLCASPIAIVLKAPDLAGYLRLFAIDIPIFSLAQAHRSILVGIGGFQQRAMVTAIRWIARLLFIVILVQAGLSIRGAIIGSIGASLIELAYCRFYVQPQLLGRISFPIRQLWGYAVPLLLCAVSMRLLNKLDLFMLQGLRGHAAETGIYGAAQNLTLIPGLFSLSFAPLLQSTLSRMVGDGELGLARRTACDAFRVVIGMLPFAALTSGVAEEIVVCVFGGAFQPASTVLAVLIFGSVGFLGISVATAILTVAGKLRWTVLITAPLVLASIAGNIWLIPKFGVLGAALVTTLVASVGALTAVATVRRFWQISIPTATLARSLLISVGAYALGVVWPVSTLLLLTLKLSAISVLILFGFYVLGEFSVAELDAVGAFFRRQPVVAHPPQG